MPRLDDPGIDIPQLVSEWLSDDGNGPWLMVLDNADDKDLFFGTGASAPQQPNSQPKSIALVHLLPRSSRGSMLITTRDKRVGERFTSREKLIVVEPFGMEDAMRLLQNKIPNLSGCNGVESRKFFEALGFLPLAINQACAFIR